MQKSAEPITARRAHCATATHRAAASVLRVAARPRPRPHSTLPAHSSGILDPGSLRRWRSSAAASEPPLARSRVRAPPWPCAHRGHRIRAPYGGGGARMPPQPRPRSALAARPPMPPDPGSQRQCERCRADPPPTHGQGQRRADLLPHATTRGGADGQGWTWGRERERRGG